MTGYESKKAMARDKLLELAQEEPVAWLCTPDKNGLFGLPLADKGCKDCFPVYTTPSAEQPAQEPVCSECKAEVLYECVACSSNNYPPKPEQEPVAWMRPSEEGYDSAFRDHSTVMVCTGNPWTGWIPLYTTPPQRPWVGLTDEQIADYLGDEYHDMSESELRFFRLGEAAAKEKNNG